MRKPLSIETAGDVIRVLSVTAIEEDHGALDRMLPAPKWIVSKSLTLGSGLAQLRKRVLPPLVLCDRDLFPGSWKEMLDGMKRLSDPPLLIVTSRLADEQLWAEALNLGAYDVLAKPFEVTEVHRILSLAWLHWRRLHERVQPLNAFATAS
jgi:DNA-binding response OmpR family regulator